MLGFTFKEILVKSFLGIFSSERILAQSCDKVQNSVLPCDISTIDSVFCRRCFGFSPILSPHRILLLGGVSFDKINLGKKE